MKKMLILLLMVSGKSFCAHYESALFKRFFYNTVIMGVTFSTVAALDVVKNCCAESQAYHIKMQSDPFDDALIEDEIKRSQVFNQRQRYLKQQVDSYEWMIAGCTAAQCAALSVAIYFTEV